MVIACSTATSACSSKHYILPATRHTHSSSNTNWMPILTQYEADWLVSGHSHNYQRMVPIRGVRYLVAGGAGGRLYMSAID